MLQITDNGANITLSGKARGTGDGLFWFAVALLFGAIGVAMAMSLLPERLAIGALAALVVFSFIFNKRRNRQKKGTATQISAGIVKVQPGQFVHNWMGQAQRIVIQADEVVTVNGSTLLIKDAQGQVTCQVTGFDAAKEAQVMQAILEGQQFGKRHANIKMQSS
ncbi:hypothetical protein [Psychrobacter lutiphocae]|uniref:hypothetical protein n=1 Tax=Psychrobacter lutiphocae TaxID=540500 RepID=UPI000373CB28|nr:hypothetical protein [Psychrobacter lutiphocae]